jgi:hypothetical protein
LIGTQTVGEYWDQLDAWKQHLIDLVDAQEDATKAQSELVQNEYQRILQKEAQERADAFGLAMIGLSLVTGPLVSFVAGKIEHVWYPKLAPMVKERAIRIKGMGKGGLWKQKMIRETHFNEVHAKVIGDLGGQVTGMGINGIISVASPDLSAAKNAQAAVTLAPDMKSFKKRLGDAFVEQAKATRGAILSLSGSIASNPNWGFECLDKLYKQYQGHVNPQRSEKATIQNLAYSMIRQDVDRMRERWANDWLFYGNNPPMINEDELRKAMEIEQWALWILSEELGVTTKTKSSRMKGDYFDRTEYTYKGKTFGNRPLPEGIVHRLADFDILAARTLSQIFEKANREKDDKTRRNTEPAPRTPAERQLRDQRWKQEDEEARQQRPSIEIGVHLDDTKEIEALQTWAKENPPTLSDAKLMSRKRTLLSIEQIIRSGKYRMN